MRFTERPDAAPRTEPLVDDIDFNLRSSLWDILIVLVFEKYFYDKKDNQEKIPAWDEFFNNIYQKFLELPLEERPEQYNAMKNDLQKWFYKNDHEFTYAFLQFMADEFDKVGDTFTFRKHINFVLEREMADRRFVDGKIRKIKVLQRPPGL